MSIEVVLPIEPDRLATPVLDLADRVPASTPRTIGLISNGKFKAAEILTAIANELVDRGVAQDHVLHTKPTASNPVTDTERAEMLARCHLVISGVGD